MTEIPGMEISDEVLMAFADGALDAQTHAHVGARVRAEPDLARRLAAFEVTGKALGELFDEVLHEPVPERLLAIVRQRSPEGTSLNVRKPVASTLLVALRNLLPSGSGYAMGAVAFGLLLALGIAGRLPGPGKTDDLAAGEHGLVARENGRLVARGNLKDALDSVPSGTRMVSAQGATLRPVLTFRNQSGQYCRQYEVGLADGQHVAGLACRGADGTWGVQLQASADTKTDGSSAKGRNDSEPGAYETASGPTRVPAIEAKIDEIIQGDALGREEEGELLRKSWR